MLNTIVWLEIGLISGRDLPSSGSFSPACEAHNGESEDCN